MRNETLIMTALSTNLWASCVTGPTAEADATSAGVQHAEQAELVYPPVWEARDLAVRTWTRGFCPNDFDYDGEFEVRDANAVEVEVLVAEEGRGELLPEFEKFIGDARARFVIIEPVAPPAHAPTAIAVVVPPSEGLPDDLLNALQPHGPAFFVELESGEGPAIEAPGAAAIRGRMERGESFVVVISSDGYRNSVAFQMAASGLPTSPTSSLKTSNGTARHVRTARARRIMAASALRVTANKLARSQQKSLIDLAPAV